MDITKLTFEEFQSRLSKLSVKELYKMAHGYGMKLPTGIEKQETILQHMHAHISASGSATAEDAKSAPSSDAPAVAGPFFKVLSTTGGDFWRCNHKWTNRWQELPVSKFSPMELKTLRDCKFLKTRGIPE